MTNYRLTHVNPASVDDRLVATDRYSAVSSQHIAILTGDPAVPCGVGDFTAGLGATLRGRGTRADEINLADPALSLRALWRRLADVRAVVANVPLVAWKRLPVKPIAALAMARLTGCKTVVVLHEWQGLHPLRRIVLSPLIGMANQIIALSPTIRDELAADPMIGWAARKVSLAPMPPNIERPAAYAETEFSQKLRAAKRDGRLVVGVFGSIYPGKLPLAALALARELKRRGSDPLLAFVGQFVRARDNIEQIFWNEARAQGLQDNVAVSGFVASEAELFGIFSEVDVFAYRFAEGMTARRSSVLAAVQSGRPVVVTAPATAQEFNHHPRFAALVDCGALVFVPRNADDAAYADTVLAASRQNTAAGNPITSSDWWRDLGAAFEALLHHTRS